MHADPPAMPKPAVADTGPQDLLSFVAPGIAHALAGPLQVLQLQSAMLGSTPADMARARESMQRAVASAERLLDLLRCYSKATPAEKPVQIGLVLPRLIDVLRYALRDRGLSLELLHASQETPVLVSLGPVANALGHVVRLVATAVPIGWRGTLLVDLHRQSAAGAVLLVRARSAPGYLPFAVKVADGLAMVATAARSDGLVVAWSQGEDAVRIEVPARKEVMAHG